MTPSFWNPRKREIFTFLCPIMRVSVPTCVNTLSIYVIGCILFPCLVDKSELWRHSVHSRRKNSLREGLREFFLLLRPRPRPWLTNNSFGDQRSIINTVTHVSTGVVSYLAWWLRSSVNYKTLYARLVFVDIKPDEFNDTDTDLEIPNKIQE